MTPKVGATFYDTMDRLYEITDVYWDQLQKQQAVKCLRDRTTTFVFPMSYVSLCFSLQLFHKYVFVSSGNVLPTGHKGIVGLYPLGTKFRMQHTKTASNAVPNYFDCEIIKHDPQLGNKTKVTSSLSGISHIEFFTDDEIYHDYMAGTIVLPTGGTSYTQSNGTLSINSTNIGRIGSISPPPPNGTVQITTPVFTLQKTECTCESLDLFNYGCKCGFLKTRSS